MTFWFLWILSLIEGGLFFALFYTKKQIIVFPLIILGIIIFSNEVYENIYKKVGNKPLFAKAGCILFIEILLFINYFTGFIDYIFE